MQKELQASKTVSLLQILDECGDQPRPRFLNALGWDQQALKLLTTMKMVDEEQMTS